MTDLNADLATIAAEALAAVVRELRRSGVSDRVSDLVRQAAEIELMSPALQACWGGPFNGQAGRTAIVEEILRQTAPRAVVETGTFRGISTAWFAAHCDVPVWSCEVEEIYLIQARRRLAGIGSVILEHADSRAFLRRVVSLLRTDGPSFFYLDAHWKDDLPLREEIGIIFAAQPRAVVMIDDFRIPDDLGYAWDDYGPGVRVDATALAGALPDGAALYVPALPSADETGARRGCCVVALEMSGDLDRCALLRRRSLSDLMPRDGDEASPLPGEMHPTVLQHGQVDDLLVSSLRDEIVKINLDRAKRLQDIVALRDLAAGTEEERRSLKAEREVHLRDNAVLSQMVGAARDEGEALKVEREIHLRDNDTLTRELLAARARIEEIEADRAQRLQDVQTLSALIHEHRDELKLLRGESSR